MKYTEYQPTSALSRYLEVFWFVSDEGDATVAQNQSERVLPDGCIEWIFHLRAPFQRSINGVWEVQQRSFVVGELTEFILLQPNGPTSTMGVRFRPGGAYRFIPAPLHLLTDQTVPTDDIWGPEGKYLEEAILEARVDSQRKALIEGFSVGPAAYHFTPSAV